MIAIFVRGKISNHNRVKESCEGTSSVHRLIFMVKRTNIKHQKLIFLFQNNVREHKCFEALDLLIFFSFMIVLQKIRS